jgi:hypothetical protein
LDLFFYFPCFIWIRRNFAVCLSVHTWISLFVRLAGSPTLHPTFAKHLSLFLQRIFFSESPRLMNARMEKSASVAGSVPCVCVCGRTGGAGTRSVRSSVDPWSSVRNINSKVINGRSRDVLLHQRPRSPQHEELRILGCNAVDPVQVHWRSAPEYCSRSTSNKYPKRRWQAEQTWRWRQ